MRKHTKFALLAVACLITGGTVAAQDKEEVSVRSVPVDASRVSSVLKASNSILDSNASLDTGAVGQAESSVNSVVRLTDAYSPRSSMQVSGGLDRAMSESLNRSTLSRLDSVQTSTRIRLSAKTVILRIFMGTVAILGFGGMFLVIATRLSGGQAAEIA